MSIVQIKTPGTWKALGQLVLLVPVYLTQYSYTTFLLRYKMEGRLRFSDGRRHLLRSDLRRESPGGPS